MGTILIIIGSTLILLLVVLYIMNRITNLDISTQIVFNASKEEVWKVLINFKAYAQWNPFMTSITGSLKEGNQLTVVMIDKGNKTTINPIVTTVKQDQSLEWSGSGLGGMFKGCHYFHLVQMGGGQTKMIHGEKFFGMLSGLIVKMMGRNMQTNYELMNKSMKKRVEKQ